VYQAVLVNRAAALDLLREIVNLDSGTGDAAGGGGRVNAVLAARFIALGAEVTVAAAEAAGLPDNVLAVWHGTGKGRILVIAHIDTVFGAGTAAARPFSLVEMRAHGPAVADEKAGVLNAVTALEILHDLGFKNFRAISLLLDDSEERGSPGSRNPITTLARQHGRRIQYGTRGCARCAHCLAQRLDRRSHRRTRTLGARGNGAAGRTQRGGRTRPSTLGG
jgi:glutamate carboxypeptidase